MQGCQPAYLILDWADQGPIQPGLEYPQEQGIHNLLGQAVPAPHHSPGEDQKGSFDSAPYMRQDS